MSGVKIRQRAASDGQRGGRKGQEGAVAPPPPPLHRASWSTVNILLNINKASKHCDCQWTIINAYDQCIEMDLGSLQGIWNLIIFLPRRMRLLFIGYCVWSFLHYPITADHVVYIRKG